MSGAPPLATCPRTPSRLRPAALAALIGLAASCTATSNDPAMQKPATPTASADGGSPSMPAPAAPPPAAPLAPHGAQRFVLTELSQVQRGGGKPTIDLRFDALDANGASTRMAGELRVTLRAPGAEPEFVAFDVRLATESEQTKHFDETLRIYVVRLEPQFARAPAAGAAIDVAATLKANDGSTLETTGSIIW